MNKLITKFKLNRTDNARKWKHQEGGVIHKAPMLDRLRHKDLFHSITFTPDEKKLKYMYLPDYYFDAGSFPEVIIKPSDLTAQQIREMIPDKEMRNNWYKDVDTKLNVAGLPTSLREYVSRVYNVWNNTGRPDIKSSRGGLHNFIFDLFAGKGREHNLFGNIYLKPEYPSLEAELAHSFKDTFHIPGHSILPADITIGGKDGYNRQGHPEYVTHQIIQPLLLRHYLGTGLDTLPKIAEASVSRYEYPGFYNDTKYYKKGGKAFVPGHDIADSNPKAYKYVKKHYKMKALYGGIVPDFSNDIINQSSMISPFVNYTNNVDNYLQKKKEKDELEKYRELLKINKSYDFWNNIANNASKLLYSIPLLLTAITTSGTTATPGYFSDFTALDVTNYMNRNSLFKPKFTF